mmetsp:Transcript_160110/g.307244  ORF Transcript_160110/g.307244 Transcript_160110/m.307244 type:complete len:611 (+) Transcript_160110:1-1833(+)
MRRGGSIDQKLLVELVRAGEPQRVAALLDFYKITRPPDSAQEAPQWWSDEDDDEPMPSKGKNGRRRRSPSVRSPTAKSLGKARHSQRSPSPVGQEQGRRRASASQGGQAGSKAPSVARTSQVVENRDDGVLKDLTADAVTECQDKLTRQALSAEVGDIPLELDEEPRLEQCCTVEEHPETHLVFLGKILIAGCAPLRLFAERTSSSLGRVRAAEASGALAMFCHCLITLARVVFAVECDKLNIFDEDRQRIAFNFSGALFFNLRYFEELHWQQSGAFDFWFLTMAHELAHNIIATHSLSHGQLLQWIAYRHLPALHELVASPPTAVSDCSVEFASSSRSLAWPSGSSPSETGVLDPSGLAAGAPLDCDSHGDNSRDGLPAQRTCPSLSKAWRVGRAEADMRSRQELHPQMTDLAGNAVLAESHLQEELPEGVQSAKVPGWANQPVTVDVPQISGNGVENGNGMETPLLSRGGFGHRSIGKEMTGTYGIVGTTPIGTLKHGWLGEAARMTNLSPPRAARPELDGRVRGYHNETQLLGTEASSEVLRSTTPATPGASRLVPPASAQSTWLFTGHPGVPQLSPTIAPSQRLQWPVGEGPSSSGLQIFWSPPTG